MAKTASIADLSPDSGINPKPAKPRTRRSRVPSEPSSETDGPAWKAHANAIEPTKPSTSTVKPILIGVGIGAAVAVTGLVVRARSQAAAKPPQRTQPTLASALGKAALFAVGRLVAQRAARVLAQRAMGMLANRAARQVAKAWIG
jgi:hypothetical protein